MSNIRYRDATEDDAAAVSALFCISFTETFGTLYAPDDLADPALEALLVHHARLVEELRERALLGCAALAQQRLASRCGADEREPEGVAWRRGGGGRRRLCGDGYPLGHNLQRRKGVGRYVNNAL